MRLVPDRYRELRQLLGGDRLREDVEEELAAHLEMRAADLESAGLPAAAAREEARRRFGDMMRYADQTLAIDVSMRKEQRRMELLDTMVRETKHAARALWRAPAFAVVAVLTLGMGIGATTSNFALIDSIVLRPLPYPAAERLVHVQHPVPGVGENAKFLNSVANYFYYADHNRSLEALGAYTGSAVSLSGDGEAERVNGTQATASLLPMLGARPVLGRLFTEADDQPGAPSVAVLSYELWQSRYGGDASVVNRTLTTAGGPVLVIGVMAPGVAVPGGESRIWTPLALDRSAPAINSHYLTVIGRLRPGVTVDAARADIQRLTAQLPEQFPNAYGVAFMTTSGFRADVTTVRAELLGSIEQVLWLLLGAVALVLTIAAANVANLLIVRAEARRRELTVRAALGAERAHLAVHYLAESMLLSLLAAALGVVLAYGGVQLLLAIAPASLPRLQEVAVDARAVGFAFGTALLVGLLFGLVPVLRSRVDFSELREGGRGLTSSRSRQFARGALVVTQVAMALVLLAAGALLLQSFLNLRNVPSGFEGENVLTFQVSPPASRYPDQPAVLQFHRELTDRIRALPGVVTASGSTSVPLASGFICSHTTWEGKVFGPNETPPCMPVVHVLPDFFDALNIAVRGEKPDWNQVAQGAGGVVLSRAAAERLWPGEDPIGKGVISFQDGPPWYRVIGVADDVRFDGLDRPPVEAIYYPTVATEGAFPSGMWRYLTFVVKSATAEPAQLTSAIRQIVAEMDPALPVASVRTMDEVVSSSPAVARRSFTLVLLAIAAGMALFLSAVGLYGVIAYLVGRRRSEIGIRMALGARIGQVGGLIVLQSVRLAAIGVVIGVLAALASTRLLESLLFGIEPADPLTIVGVSVLLLLVAMLASLLPARRAARTDPVEALRGD